jgi:Cys-tRNA(Pro)/Cys-tRNA(Cys) deacylase
MATPVSETLKAMNIPHRLFRHPGPIHSLAQAARERGQQQEQIVRSILFRIAADEFVMVLIAGPQQINWRALRRYLGQPRMTMASKEEVLRVTGYQLGAVSPFGLPAPLRVLVDESVAAETEVSIGSGERGTTVILSSADLLAALDACALGRVEQVRVGKATAA